MSKKQKKIKNKKINVVNFQSTNALDLETKVLVSVVWDFEVLAIEVQ